MMGVDLVTALLLILAFVVALFLLDCLLAGGGMTGAVMGGMMHGTAAMLGSPYGWLVIVTLVLIILAAFGFLFR